MEQEKKNFAAGKYKVSNFACLSRRDTSYADWRDICSDECRIFFSEKWFNDNSNSTDCTTFVYSAITLVLNSFQFSVLKLSTVLFCWFQFVHFLRCTFTNKLLLR